MKITDSDAKLSFFTPALLYIDTMCQVGLQC